MKWSLIIPAHNSSKYIVDLFDSIPRRDDLEVVVVDDHSDEGEVVLSYLPLPVFGGCLIYSENSGGYHEESRYSYIKW